MCTVGKQTSSWGYKPQKHASRAGSQDVYTYKLQECSYIFNVVKLYIIQMQNVSLQFSTVHTYNMIILIAWIFVHYQSVDPTIFPCRMPSPKVSSWKKHIQLRGWPWIIQCYLFNNSNQILFHGIIWVTAIYDDLSKWGLISGQSVTELEASIISIIHLLCKIIHVFVSFIDVHCLRPGHSRSCPAWFELHVAIGNWAQLAPYITILWRRSNFSVLIFCTDVLIWEICKTQPKTWNFITSSPLDFWQCKIHMHINIFPIVREKGVPVAREKERGRT